MTGCQSCQKNISLCDIKKETKCGVTYILHKCNECKSQVKICTTRYHTNAEVKSDEGRHNVFEINSLCAAGNCLCQVFGAFHNTAVPLRQLNLAVKSWADFYYRHSIECCILVEDIQIFKTGTADVQFCFPTTF